MFKQFKENSIILFQGDSITDCGRDREDQESLGEGYVNLITETVVDRNSQSNLKFINRGISGDKIRDLQIIKDGGWHFSYLNTPELIEQKLKSYTHHREYDLNPIGLKNIAERIKNRESVYNLSIDKRVNKFSSGVKLKILNEVELPKYLIDNKEKFKIWLE